MRLPLLTRFEAAVTLARRGLVPPLRPDKLFRQALLLWRWGPSLATAYLTRALVSPTDPAIAAEDRELSYGEVDARTNAIARALSRFGVREADRVGVLSRNGSEFVEAVVACAKLGADVLLVNTSFSATELERVTARDKPRLLICDAEFEELVTRAATDVERVLAHVEEPDRRGKPTLDQLAREGDTAALNPPEHESRSILLTSGTTGTPKGARLGRPENIEPLAWFLRVVPLRARSTIQIAAPLFHGHGYGQLAIGAGLGSKLVLARHFDPEQTLALIERHEAQALIAVPVMLKRIMELPSETRKRYETGSLEVVLSSGSALTGELARSFMEEFGPVLYNLYGSTEVAWATIATPKDLIEAPGTVGRPPLHTALAILDRDGRPLPPGETGRIFIDHEMLFDGYTDDSAVRAIASGMMTAGDLGHVDVEGRLFIDSREDDMIISGGENVYPGEVETVLAEHPEIEEAAAIGVEDEQFGERLLAFVMPRRGSSLSSQDVLEYSKQRLARYKQPREVRIVDELPRNALGKVLKKKLRQAAMREDV